MIARSGQRSAGAAVMPLMVALAAAEEALGMELAAAVGEEVEIGPVAAAEMMVETVEAGSGEYTP